MNKSKLVEINNRFEEIGISIKGENAQFLAKKTSKLKEKESNKKDYQPFRRFDVMNIRKIEKLIVPVKEDSTIR